MKKLIYLIIILSNTLSSTATSLSSLELANVVYDKLKAAKGDFSQQLPVLEVSDRVYNIAAYQRSNNKLIIEEKAIEICRSFGAQQEAALAFLIGHELTHYYQDHEGGFAFMMEKATFTEKVKEEKEADLYGAMIAYLADYQVLEIIPDLIQQLYNGYDLQQNQMPNYPPLAERLSIATTVQEELKYLIDVYEIGNYLAAMGEFTAATDCFRIVGEVVKSKEVLHNQAVSMLSAAAQIQEYNQILWAYPLQLDAKNPLRLPDDVQKGILLKKAERLLRDVLSMDNRYFSAHLNLAIVYTLKGDYNTAQHTLEQAKNLANGLQKQQCQLLTGILQAQKGELDTAMGTWNNLVKSEDQGLQFLAQKNLALAAGKTFSSSSNTTRKASEIIDNINLNYAPTLSGIDKSIPLSEDIFSPRSLKIKYLANSMIAIIDLANRQIALQIIKKQSPKALRIGENIGDLTKHDKNIHIVRFTNRKNLLVFSKSMLIFQLDSQNKLREWAIFGIY